MYGVRHGNTSLPSAFEAVMQMPDRPDYDKRSLVNLILKTNKTDEEISKITKYSVAHVAKTRRGLGGYKRFIERRYPEDIRKVRSLALQGMGIQEIMDQTGYTRGFVEKSSVDIRLLQNPSRIPACAQRAGMPPLAYVTLRRMENMLRMHEIKPWEFEDAKKRLPSGDVSPQVAEWMLKTGRVINICPTGENLSAFNKKKEAQEQEDAKRDRLLKKRRFNQW